MMSCVGCVRTMMNLSSTLFNKCEAISRTCDIEDVYSMEKDMVVMVVTRMKEFIKLSEEKEKSDSAVVQEVTD